MIHYQIIPYQPEAHIYRVIIDIPSPDKSGQILSMPAWISGSYMVRDFAKNIVSIAAVSQGEVLEIGQIDKQKWRISATCNPIKVTYDVYAWDLSVRTAYLDRYRAYFNGPSVFLQVHGSETTQCAVDICTPEGERYVDWRVATSLKSDGLDRHQFGIYLAEGYFDLIDHPVEIGLFESATFMVDSIPHEIVISGHHKADMGRLCLDLKRICEEQRKLFGRLPFERYLFLVTTVGDGYGGLEHKYSTSLLCNRDDLPRLGQGEISEGYRQFLGLCSHEYFHLWNAKRIRPSAFSIGDLQIETYTRLLWVFEGITSYYDELMLVRSGVISTKSYLELLAQTITKVIRGSGRFKQTLEESSFNTWTKFYKQDESAPNSIVSYYSKGALVALALDLKIRAETAGRLSLDDIMRELWQRHGETGIGLPEDGFESLAEEITGLNLAPFFQRYLRGTEDLPLKQQLESLGIDLVLRQKNSQSDLGGFVTKSVEESPRLTLGVKFSPDINRVKLQQVFDDGSAQQAGLSAGDELIAIDGIKIMPENIEKLLSACSSEDLLNVHLFRRDELLQMQVRLQFAPENTCDLMLNESAMSEMIKKRQSWLLTNEG
ncbi:MAG: PDZ domain-containing protein [Candidatus Polarisedimenticolaceae bacterium]|nr:PDZ domain-containing protein [Candidatus Polarisedimenticolaceae bacterium]